MRAVTAREADQGFSELLSQVEKGEEVLITKHGTPVAKLVPYQLPAMTPERQAAIERAIALMRKGFSYTGDLPHFTRDEMHER